MYVASNGTKTAVILRDTDPENPRDPYYQENLGNMVCWHKRYNLGDKHTFDDPIDFAQDLALKNTSWSELLQYIKDGHTKDLRLVPEGERYQLQSRGIYDKDKWADMDGFWFPADFSDSAAISKRLWDEAQGEITDVLKEMYTPELIGLCEDKVAILPLYLYDHSGLTMSTSDFGDRWDSGCVGFIYMDKDTAMKEIGMAGDEVRIAQAIEGRRAQPIKLRRKSDRDPAQDALIAQGYQKVKDLDEITNLNGPDVARYNGLRETLKDTMGQGLYKKDNKLYAFAGYNDDLTFNLNRHVQPQYSERHRGNLARPRPGLPPWRSGAVRRLSPRRGVRHEVLRWHNGDRGYMGLLRDEGSGHPQGHFCRRAERLVR